MKVLWLCYIMLPSIAEKHSRPINNTGGWIVGLSEDLLKCDDIELSICFPVLSRKYLVSGEVGKLRYYSFYKNPVFFSRYEPQHEKEIKEIINEVKPDILHIFGSEFPYTLAAVKAFNNPSNTVISIQGLVSVYAKHYCVGLPNWTLYPFTLRDIVRGNIYLQKKRYAKRGLCETEALKLCNHVVGRTDWDKACALAINSQLTYHHCNETLRNAFYTNRWSFDNVEKYSIFMSQAQYPIKGLHFLLEAMPSILRAYPSARLYIAGSDVTRSDANVKNRLNISFYGIYIGMLMKKLKLTDIVTFTGELSEIDICERLLKSHVFVTPSTIENSPNSLAEAMVLGVPCVAADVGGISSMFTHNADGYLYQHDAPYMLAYYVCKIFEENLQAIRFGENARSNARITHDRHRNTDTMIDIYRKVKNFEGMDNKK